MFSNYGDSNNPMSSYALDTAFRNSHMFNNMDLYNNFGGTSSSAAVTNIALSNNYVTEDTNTNGKVVTDVFCVSKSKKSSTNNGYKDGKIKSYKNDLVFFRNDNLLKLMSGVNMISNNWGHNSDPVDIYNIIDVNLYLKNNPQLTIKDFLTKFWLGGICRPGPDIEGGSNYSDFASHRTITISGIDFVRNIFGKNLQAGDRLYLKLAYVGNMYENPDLFAEINYAELDGSEDDDAIDDTSTSSPSKRKRKPTISETTGSKKKQKKKYKKYLQLYPWTRKMQIDLNQTDNIYTRYKKVGNKNYIKVDDIETSCFPTKQDKITLNSKNEAEAAYMFYLGKVEFRDETQKSSDNPFELMGSEYIYNRQPLISIYFNPTLEPSPGV